MKNRELMSSGNPFKAVIIFSIPSILAMLINSIYNVVDKIFIGNFVSHEALAGLQVVAPLTFLAFSVIVMFGLGSATYASNKLGEKKDSEANKVFNNSFVLSSIIVIAIMIVFFALSSPLLTLCGALPENRSYAEDYLFVLIFGFIFQSMSYFFTMNIRSEGRPVYSMIAQVSGCLVNIALDALFIIAFQWGVFGAALATVLGHISNFIIGLHFYLFSKKNYFKLNLKDGFDINWGFMAQVVLIGLSSAILNICNFVSTIIYNNVIGKYTNALSILAILTSLDALCIMPCVGIRQGLLPIFGYNYGEKKYDRIFKVYGVGLIYGLIFGIVICTLIMSFPRFFINLFVDGTETEDLINEAARILRFYPIGITIISINMNTSALYQATRAKFKASMLSALRQCIYLIPSLYILDALFGQTGVWNAMPLSDTFSAITGFILFIVTYIFYKKTGFLSYKDLKNSLKRENEVLE